MKLNEAIFPKNRPRPQHREHVKRQRQDSLKEQLRDLMKLAVQNGMYDAADFIQNHVLENRDIVAQAVKRRSYSAEERDESTQLVDNGPKNS